MFFSLCLCGLIAFQWVRETDLRKTVQSLTDTIHDKSEAIQNLQVQLRHDEDEIKRLDAIKNDLNATVRTNRQEIASLNKSLDKANFENDKNLKQIEVYKDAVKTANENIARQNDEIKKQNEDMKKLAEDRNEMVKKFNKLAADYNDLANKWNKQQEDLAKAATNPPAKKK
jgi:chromosome segregation ATPase